MLAMRAFLFYTGYSLSGIVFGALALLIMPLAYPRRAAILLQWNRFNVFWVRLCCGVKFEIKGNTQALDQACVILANHQSSWETVFLQAHFSPVATVLKQELLNIPFFGWGLKALAAIPIDRGNPRAAIKKIRQEGIERLQNGISVLVFPEGTRQAVGSPGNFARSGADIAIAAGVPIIAVAHNAGVYWPAHKTIKTPGTITVTISDAIATEQGNSKELTAQVKNWIESQTIQ